MNSELWAEWMGCHLGGVTRSCRQGKGQREDAPSKYSWPWWQAGLAGWMRLIHSGCSQPRQVLAVETLSGSPSLDSNLRPSAVCLPPSQSLIPLQLYWLFSFSPSGSLPGWKPPQHSPTGDTLSVVNVSPRPAAPMPPGSAFLKPLLTASLSHFYSPSRLHRSFFCCLNSL